ncbi:Lrp/AsnC family transcriptional regulator [Shewanella psychropiezotolerans]|uniref:Lrp/AsnC family transcriptional regulator n=1 Tax=Shewanella psychropiezotolerans TaxID=2593655 RepID=A0ABX5WX29_9GAMM|nr:Lrp/AsnC family transcriptional regulator [Shewanella psychropiezotolerans]QDO83650.1 Lrp/AsnC family transcriptional regulator [Shewanella psychropiezotolerans]
MDAIDLKILEQLQIDAKVSMGDLAHKIGLSEPACYRRVRLLRKSGVIEREIAVVKPKSMGWPLSMMVMITLERDHSSILNQFLTRINKEPEVLDSWYVTGDFDLILRVVAKDMEAYDEFTTRVLHKDDSVKVFQTQVVMRHAKINGPIPASL